MTNRERRERLLHLRMVYRESEHAASYGPELEALDAALRAIDRVPEGSWLGRLLFNRFGEYRALVQWLRDRGSR